ncbi:MAG: histidinol-phosphate transaminase [Planctomycetota bacterium]
MCYIRDDIARMKGYTPGFQPDEPGFVKLNTNENPYPPSPDAIEAMREACSEDIRKYPDPLGQPFREAAAELFGLRPENILCGCGSDDILTIAVRTFCDRGDTIAFPYPTYSLYDVLAQIQGCRPVTTDFPEDYSVPEDLPRIGAELTFLANPNAPSGTLISPDRVLKLADSVDGVLLIDEAYVDFARTDCLRLVQSCKNVVVSRTLSKSYGLAGLRFGFAMADEKLIAGMLKAKDSYNVSAPGVAGATAAIQDRAHLRSTVERITNTRERLHNILTDLGFHCWPSQTNFVLARAPEDHEARDIFQKLFEQKILVRYFDLPRLDDCLRITVGTGEEIDRLGQALKEILQRGRG